MAHAALVGAHPPSSANAFSHSLDPKATLTNPPAREVITHGKDEFAFCGRCGVVGLALTPPYFSNSPISKDYRGRNLQTVMTKYCARVWRVASAVDRRQQQGHDFAVAGPPSATLNCPSRGRTSAAMAVVSADTKHDTPAVAGTFPAAAKLG